MPPGNRGGTVTVQFTELVESTEILSRVREAAFDQLRQAHFAALREAIGRTGGEEVKSTGDVLMAVFLTRRHPGDGERARELLGQALHTARQLGLGKVERDAVVLLG